MIKAYSKKQDGDTLLSPSFRVREFACNDGSDTIKIDEKLVEYLQRIRNWAGAPLIISSGYRTPAYNEKIGGSSSSYHTKGQAADIYVKGRKKSIYEIAKYAEAIGIKGIERNEDGNYVHVDTRTKKYFWYREYGRDHEVNTFGGRCPYSEPQKTLRRGSIGTDVRWLQTWLRFWDYNVAVDGKFGQGTEAAVKSFQRQQGLSVDGAVGTQTRAALKGF